MEITRIQQSETWVQYNINHNGRKWGHVSLLSGELKNFSHDAGKHQLFKAGVLISNADRGLGGERFADNAVEMLESMVTKRIGLKKAKPSDKRDSFEGWDIADRVRNARYGR